MKRILFAAVLAAALLAAALLRPSANDASATAVMQDQGMTLVTATPDEGFALAVTLSRRGVTTTQPDREVLHELRPVYASDANALIASSHVVAVHFQTIAAANNYWRSR